MGGIRLIAQNSGLFGAPKSGTSVSAAGVNDHRELGTPRTISLQRNHRRGKRAITPFCCLQFLLFAAVLHPVRQQRFGQPWKTLLAVSSYLHFERLT
jgi:hypothetical protein